jgi:stage V sporulation protein B
MHAICLEKGIAFSLNMAIWGLVIGEAASTLVSLACFHALPEHECDIASAQMPLAFEQRPLPQNWYLQNLLSMAIPLTASRVVLNLFATFENTMIPARLRAFGYTDSEALSVYGILTGMAMAVIMFPSVLTNSISVLLLPTISEAEAAGDVSLINRTIRKTVQYCLLLGFGCTAGFLFTGSFLGNFLFQNALAGTFITTLGWICPFLYISSTLNSILHGLGYPGTTFALNLLACGIRILFVQYAVPLYGIKSYLAGILASQIVIASLALLLLLRKAARISATAPPLT